MYSYNRCSRMYRSQACTSQAPKPQKYIFIRIHSSKGKNLMQQTHVQHTAKQNYILHSVYVLSVYTVHCVANVVLNYTKSFNGIKLVT